MQCTGAFRSTQGSPMRYHVRPVCFISFVIRTRARVICRGWHRIVLVLFLKIGLRCGVSPGLFELSATTSDLVDETYCVVPDQAPPCERVSAVCVCDGRIWPVRFTFASQQRSTIVTFCNRVWWLAAVVLFHFWVQFPRA